MNRQLGRIVISSLLSVLAACGRDQVVADGEQASGDTASIASPSEIPSEPPPPMLAAPDYGDVAFLVSGPAEQPVLHRFGDEGWTPFGWNGEAALVEGEHLVDGQFERAPDGRLYLLSNRRVFEIEDGDAQQVKVHAQLPLREPATAEPHAFAPGPGGELWTV
ncbi:MAG: hypothetical protein KC431_24655, partial [Myxococcales bacterium]|nr:hypothetical protein [Myxococcales bacterium]